MSDLLGGLGFVAGFLLVVLAVMLFPDYLPSRRVSATEQRPSENVIAARDRLLVRFFVRYWKCILLVAITLTLVSRVLR